MATMITEAIHYPIKYKNAIQNTYYPLAKMVILRRWSVSQNVILLDEAGLDILLCVLFRESLALFLLQSIPIPSVDYKLTP